MATTTLEPVLFALDFTPACEALSEAEHAATLIVRCRTCDRPPVLVCDLHLARLRRHLELVGRTRGTSTNVFCSACGTRAASVAELIEAAPV